MADMTAFPETSLCNPYAQPCPYWVLANSHPNGLRSFIANRHGIKFEEMEEGGQNALVMKTWDELDISNGVRS